MKQTIFIALGIFFLTIANVLACSCIYLPDAESKMNNANIVFTGKVVNLDKSGENFRAQFQVYEYWRMEEGSLSGDKLTVTSVENTGANCGFNFVEGNEYLIYGYKSEDRISTSSCSGNLALSEATDEIEQLNALTNPTTPEQEIPVQEVPEEKPTNETQNIFQKFFSWIKRLFK